MSALAVGSGPALGTTTAATASPHLGSGIPMTATSLTAIAPQGTEIRRFDDDASAMQALLSGQVDAIGCSTTVAAQIAKRAGAEDLSTPKALRDGTPPYQKKKKAEEGFFQITMCRHCPEAPCIQACPVEAISKDPESGLVSIASSKCTSCGQCVKVCPWQAPVLASEDGIAKICDRCEGDPLCVKFCQPRALRFAKGTNSE